MVEGTRSKVMEDKLARHEEVLAEVVRQQQEMRDSQTGIQGTLELILDRLMNLERNPNRRNGDQPQGDGLLPFPGQENRNNRLQMVPIPPPKWELPSFDGHDPKVWIRKCERYFSLYKTIEQQKVEGAALYLTGDAEGWYHALLVSKGVVGWTEFKEELCSRFSLEPLEDVVEEFNKLSQTGTVDELLREFEDLKAQMLIRNPTLNESHFLSSFIGELKEEIKYGVKLFKPTTLKFAVEQARLQEKAIESLNRKNQGSYKPLVAMGSFQTNAQTPKAVVNPPGKSTAFRLTPDVYEYRKTNHLCFRCGEKFAPGHICKKRQLNCLVGEIETKMEVNEGHSELIIEGEIEQEIQEAMCLSALSGGNRGVNSILVKGIVKNRNLVVLVDSGSTHSFIDEHTMKETGYKPSYCAPVRVTVADGNYVMCTSNCKGFMWKMRDKSFHEDLLIIPLGGCDIVLGNDWMKKYNPKLTAK